MQISTFLLKDRTWVLSLVQKLLLNEAFSLISELLIEFIIFMEEVAVLDEEAFGAQSSTMLHRRFSVIGGVAELEDDVEVRRHHHHFGYTSLISSLSQSRRVPG
uniref:Uncharacterized protein n=1 Tax=Davidia involucrata TaxID=16924 RepID=A0A5B7BJK5_DAVIN